MRFASVTWVDGDFNRTASVLSFDSKKARDAYSKQSSIRVQKIDSKRKKQLLNEGRPHRLVLWDVKDPSLFIFRM
jgi:hypothetical protein